MSGATTACIDLREIKTKMELDPNDTSDDKILLFIEEQAVSWIEEVLNRQLVYKTRTEFYNGTGTQKLNLKARPVFVTVPAPYTSLTVWEDTNNMAYFGSAPNAFTDDPLVYGTDYCLRLDDDDGTASRSGILIRINNVWQKPSFRQQGYLAAYVGDDAGSIKVKYTAGFTADTMPPVIRMAVSFLVIRIRRLFPLGYQLSSESYEERSIGIMEDQKHYLMGLVMPMLINFRNWKW